MSLIFTLTQKDLPCTATTMCFQYQNEDSQTKYSSMKTSLGYNIMLITKCATLFSIINLCQSNLTTIWLDIYIKA